MNNTPGARSCSNECRGCFVRLQLRRDFIVGQRNQFQRDAGVLLPECVQHLCQIGQIVRHQSHTDA